MGSTPLATRKTLLETTLGTMDTHATMYFQATANTNELSKQLRDLEGQQNELQGRLNLEMQSADVYDRQFLDPTKTKGSQSEFGRRGINTFQDWVFLIFFVVYTFTITVLIMYSSFFSSKKLLSIGIFLVGGFVFAVMLVAILVRFA